MAAPPDPDALLCEACGYPIDGLPEDGNCPECGRPIAQSLPAARPGSPWQQRPSPQSWIDTNLAALRAPAPLFSSLLVDPRRGTGLFVINTLIAAIGVLAPWYGTLIGDPVRSARLQHRHEWSTAAWAVPLQALFVALLFTSLTLVEWLGIQFYARRRGQRLTPAAAWQVCTHASVGWVAMSALMFLGILVTPLLAMVGLGSLFSGSASAFIFAIPPLLGAFAGLMIFESLVYVGVNRCRYANRPRPSLAPA